MTDYPASRARVDKGANKTYRLDVLDRDVVGFLHMLGLYTNTAIGAAYGIDRAAVSRHGKRIRQTWEG